MIVYRVKMQNGNILLDGRMVRMRSSDKNKRRYGRLDNKKYFGYIIKRGENYGR